MDIGKRLRELRESRGMSQGDIYKRTGFLRSYISRIETGCSIPSLPVLEKWADALEVGLLELFPTGNHQPEAVVFPQGMSYGRQERKLLERFAQLSDKDKSFVIALAGEMVKRNGKNGQSA